MTIFLDFIAAFAVSLLSGLGIGGGGLFVIYLTFLRDTGQLEAQGINLVFFIFAAIGALCINIKKRKLSYKLALLISFFGIIGVLIGSWLLTLFEVGIIRILFGILLIFSGVAALFKK